MKVKDVLTKINGHTLKLPVFVENLYEYGTRREIHGPEIAGHYYDEEDRTVKQIDINPDRVVVYYK